MKALTQHKSNPPARRRTQPKATGGANTLLIVGLLILVAYLFLKVQRIEGHQGETWEIKWNEEAMLAEERKFRRNLRGMLEKDFAPITKVSVRGNRERLT